MRVRARNRRRGIYYLRSEEEADLQGDVGKRKYWTGVTEQKTTLGKKEERIQEHGEKKNGRTHSK